MDLNEVKEYLGEDWRKVEDAIRNAIRSDIRLLDTTNAAILSNSGKMLRPMIAILLARACSGARLTEASYLYAASSELLHNATLLHDDVADNSKQRRGNPTIMSLLGPTASVLIGDFWLVKAMEGILSTNDNGNVIRIFSRTLSDLAEGEMLQLEKAQKGDTSEDDYCRIIYNKTASLFRASALSAAISVSASEEVIEAAGKYAELLGMAFQIRDDIFDYMPCSKAGKPVGVDILEQKITLPLLGAMANAGEDREAEVRKMVSQIDEHPACRDEIVRFVRNNGGMEYAQEKLQAYIDKAVSCLGILPDSREKAYLVELAGFVGQRIS
ncbi:MAG: polyprenyl synthetase family protein [Bacteroidales bacterium]|nr:polyprenyl synthetase family protein [Bacteroides sp.]MCM1198382.1 polyprenyl synthetase family protein [Clostridium sp.]MCM1503198.1 polyprenyl synthetase family protein [Bacteroidales bacterium]